MKKLLLLLVGTSAAGCVAGRNFEPPSYESLVLSQTTRQEVVDRFGKPFQEGSGSRNGFVLKTLTYAYASNGSGHNGSSTIPARAMVFQFHDDLLVSYIFQSSFEADHTEFDDSRIAEIKKGETTRDAVIELLGPPKGKCAYPVTQSKGEEGISYAYHQTKRKFMGGFNIYSKEVIVSFGADGKVSDVRFSTSGEK
jgi:hypothetical protein